MHLCGQFAQGWQRVYARSIKHLLGIFYMARQIKKSFPPWIARCKAVTSELSVTMLPAMCRAPQIEANTHSEYGEMKAYGLCHVSSSPPLCPCIFLYARVRARTHTHTHTKLPHVHNWWILFSWPSWGLPCSSVGKESICNAEDPSSILGLGRSAVEGIGYPLQYSWASHLA